MEETPPIPKPCTMNTFKNRKQLYKSPRGSPPAWKDTYRKKCFESLRARRANLIDHFRFSNSPSKLASDSTSPSKVVNDVMEAEWNRINQSRSFPSLFSAAAAAVASEDSDEEIMREVLLQIQNELQNEDDLLLNEIVQYDSNDLKSKVEMFEMTEVICPICKVRNLEEEVASPAPRPPNPFQTPPKGGPPTDPNPVSVLKCRCGLILSGLHLSLHRVHSGLQNTVRNHERTCPSPLHFSATEAGNGNANILVTCSSCDWMTFLL